MTFQHRVIRVCYLPTTRVYPLNPRSFTDDKSNDQSPIHLSTFPRDQSRRLGLGPTYAVLLSIVKIHYNFSQQRSGRKRKRKPTNPCGHTTATPRQQHTTGTKRSTHPQPCTTAVKQYYSSTAVRSTAVTPTKRSTHPR